VAGKIDAIVWPTGLDMNSNSARAPQRLLIYKLAFSLAGIETGGVILASELFETRIPQPAVMLGKPLEKNSRTIL